MVKISEHLKDAGFIVCQPKDKKPQTESKGDDWNNKIISYDEANTYLEQGFNVGLVAGINNYLVIDCDRLELAQGCEGILPETYTEATISGGMHYIFKTTDKVENQNAKFMGDAIGEVRCNRQYVVIAPSQAINKKGELKTYEIFKNLEPAYISNEQVKELLILYDKTDSTSVSQMSRDLLERISKDELTLKLFNGNIEGYASRSEAEQALVFKLVFAGLDKKEIFIVMGNSKIGKWQEAHLKYREITYDKAMKMVTRKSILEEATEEQIKIVWDDELKGYQEEEKEWIVEKLIPTRSVCVLTGKRGTMKTFITLLMSYCIASGKDFLNQFKCRQGKVIYLDKENGLGIMKKRTEMIRKGLDMENNQNVGFICFSQLKIDKNTDIWKIEDIIEKYKPLVLVVDTYRRGISFDENDAGQVSHLFVDILRPMVEKHNISIILIHHNRKSSGEGGDEMDEIRGSSDLANYADIIFKVERTRGSALVLKQLKNRNAQEEEPIKIKEEFEEDSIKLSYEGTYEKKTASEKGAEILILWISEGRIHQFKTSQAKEIAFKRGIKERNFFNALNELSERGIIKELNRGEWEVCNY